MKKTLVLLTATVLSFGAFAQNDQAYLTETFDAAGIENLNVKTSDGGIFVKGEANAEATVEVFVTGNGPIGKRLSDSEISERLEDYTITVEKQGNTLVCIAKSNRQLDWRESLEITFKILSPENVDAHLRTSDGAISLRNLNGDLDFSSSDGDIKLAGLTGSINGRSSDGDITIRNAKNWVKLSTSDGDISVENADADIELKTSDGDIDITNVKGKVSARTSDGTIHIDRLEGELVTSTSDGDIRINDMDGSLEAKTGDGDISGNLQSIGNFLTLRTGDGDIDLEIPMNKGMNLDIHGDPVSMSVDNNFKGTYQKRTIKGTLNGGGAEVYIRTGDGHVRIN